MMKMFKNLRFRLLAGLFIFLFIVFYIFGVIFVHLLKKNYYDSIESRVATVINDLSYEYKTGIKYLQGLEEIKEEFNIEISYIQIEKIEKDKRIILEKSNDLREFSLNIDIDPSKLEYKKIYYFNEKNRSLTKKPIKVGVTLLEKDSSGYTLMLSGIPYNKDTPNLHEIKTLLTISLIFLLFIILLIVNIIIKKSLNQINYVLAEVRSIQIDGQIKRINKTGVAEEIDELIVTFNNLIDNLQLSYKNVKEFGQNASHELKTPLTIIKGEVQLGLRKQRTQEEYLNILKTIETEISSLQDTIEKILFLSINHPEDLKRMFEDIYIEEIVEEVVNEKLSFAKSKNISLNIKEKNFITVVGNYVMLKIVISNIIDNAIKYSNENSKINLYLSEDKLIIEDFGMGISEENLNKIFDRFFRISKARNHLDGTGLGLSIVKNILDIHNFKIEVKSQKDIGTTFAIIFN